MRVLDFRADPLARPKRIGKADEEKPAAGGLDADLADALAALKAAGGGLWRTGARIEVTGADEETRARVGPVVAANAGAILCAAVPPKKDADEPLPTDVLGHFKVRAKLVTDPAVALADLEKMRDRGRIVGIDFETAPTRPVPIEIRITKAGQLVKVQPAATDPGGLDPYNARPRVLSAWSGKGPIRVIDLEKVPLATLAPVLAELHLVAYNATFELLFLIGHAGIEPKRIDDPILLAAGHLGYRPALADIVTRTYRVKLPKGLQAGPWDADLDEERVAYAALDAFFARRLLDDLDELFDEESGTGIASRWYEADRACLVVSARMEMAGLPVDRAALDAVADHWMTIAEAVKTRFDALAPGINPGSSKQLGAWIGKTVPAQRLADWPRTDTGALRTDKKTLEAFAELDGIRELRDHRLIDTKARSFGVPILARINPATGRIHGSFIVAGARTGRYASRGPNLQQMPRGDYRRAFRAGRGRVIVSIDYKNIEVVIAALEAGEIELLETIGAGRNIHADLGAELANLDPGEVGKGSDAYQLGKVSNFGTLYGCGWRGFQAQARGYGVDLDDTDAFDMLEEIKRLRPRITHWQRNQAIAAEYDRVARTPLSRAVPVYAGTESELVRGGGDFLRNRSLSIPIQGGAAEAMKLALPRADRGLREAGVDAVLVATVHDEIVADVAEVDAEETALIIREAMADGFAEVYGDYDGFELIAGVIVPPAETAPTWGGDALDPENLPDALDFGLVEVLALEADEVASIDGVALLPDDRIPFDGGHVPEAAGEA